MKLTSLPLHNDTAAAKDRKERSKNGSSKKYKRKEILSIIADKADAAVAAQKPIEEERAAAAEHAGEANAATVKGPAATAAAHDRKEKISTECTRWTGEAQSEMAKKNEEDTLEVAEHKGQD